MSGSEVKQNDRMSAKEIEAEEMAQELMNMAMYEEGMEYDQMKEILQAINESKHMAGIKPNNRSSQEIIKYLPDITISKLHGKNNSTRDVILDDNSVPKPSYSYRQMSGRASPAPLGRRSVLEGVVDEEMSVASPDMFTIEESKRPSTERDPISDESMNEDEAEDQQALMRTKSKNEWPLLPRSSPNPHHSENNDNDKSRKNQRVERWRIDPLDAVVDENDVPLQQRNTPTAEERVPYSFCHCKRTLEEPSIGEKVIAVLSYALEEAGDIWRRNHRPEVSEFQWGLPIKVGANIRNTDKKTVTEEADSPPQRTAIPRLNPDSAQRRNMDRNCKRKAVEYIKQTGTDQTESEESDQDIFEKIKKPKTTDKAWESLTKSNVNNKEKNMTRQEKMFSNLNSAKAADPLIIEEYDSDDIYDDNLISLRLKQKKKNDETSKPPSPEFMPRRIIPPNPSKPKVARSKPQTKNGGKGIRKSPVRKNAQATLGKYQNSQLSVSKGRGKNSAGKNTVTLNDDEIMDELDNDMPAEEEVHVEIKPKPIKGLAGKLQISASKLIETKKAEERLEKSKKEEQLKKEQEEKLRREQIQIDRYLKEKAEEREREAKEAQIKAKEEIYRQNGAIRDRERRKNQIQEKRGMLLMDDEDVGEAIHDVDNDRIQCPICNLEFSLSEIQDHAAECEQYGNTDNPGPSRTPVVDDDVAITNEDAMHDCHLCEKYSTSNPVAYEEHVNICSKRERNGVGSPSRKVVEVPTSPIRCFVPISEQTGSSINYAEQFPDRSTKSNIMRRKRNK